VESLVGLWDERGDGDGGIARKDAATGLEYADLDAELEAELDSF